MTVLQGKLSASRSRHGCLYSYECAVSPRCLFCRSSRVGCIRFQMEAKSFLYRYSRSEGQDLPRRKACYFYTQWLASLDAAS
jgi:hypothetical protein